MVVVTVLLSLASLLQLTSSQFPPYTETCEHGLYPPDPSRAVKEYVINLDLAPIDRWTELATEKRQEVVHILATFKSYISEFGEIAAELIYFVDLFGTQLDELLPWPYADEIRGISKATGIEIGEVVLYNIFYELFTVCTSIIAQDPNGKMYHARNLDFGLFMGWNKTNHSWKVTDALRPAVVNLDFRKNNVTIYKSASYAGYVGIITAVSPGKFTFSMNERFNIDGGYLGIIEKIKSGNGSWMGFLTRHVMENATSYEDAKYMLSNTLMIAPAYFILGGNSSGQACIITRKREVNGTDVLTMSETSKGAGGWYLLETNYDHWSKPLFIDDRRTPGNRCMRKMTQKGVGFPGLFDVLSSKPVRNKLTTYTALMQVADGHLETWLQYCPDPCFPW